MRLRRRIGLVLATVMLCVATDVRAQPESTRELVERLRAQRLRVVLAERAATQDLATPVWGPVDVPSAETFNPQKLFWWLPKTYAPRVELAPRTIKPPPDTTGPPPAPTLDEIEWAKVRPDSQAVFLDRFREVLWTNEGMTGFTALDTTQTSDLRALLNGRFGAPTRTAVARGVRGFEGSLDVQFEYWFVVNDSIPFVLLDTDGPFGKGLVLAGDFERKAVLGQLKQALTRELVTHPRRMAYVDYYRHSEERQWYRVGYDGETYFVVAIDRPRWARRRSESGKWYLFR